MLFARVPIVAWTVAQRRCEQSQEHLHRARLASATRLKEVPGCPLLRKMGDDHL